MTPSFLSLSKLSRFEFNTSCSHSRIGLGLLRWSLGRATDGGVEADGLAGQMEEDLGSNGRPISLWPSSRWEGGAGLTSSYRTISFAISGWVRNLSAFSCGTSGLSASGCCPTGRGAGCTSPRPCAQPNRGRCSVRRSRLVLVGLAVLQVLPVLPRKLDLLVVYDLRRL
jgi:hypothetical protein